MVLSSLAARSVPVWDGASATLAVHAGGARDPGVKSGNFSALAVSYGCSMVFPDSIFLVFVRYQLGAMRPDQRACRRWKSASCKEIDVNERIP